jgi:phospholipid/cholesterol/gamma-HCH transport system substrate-binding protein
VADSSVWLRLKRLKTRPPESYNKTWLGFIAVAVVAVVIGAMLAAHVLSAGYRHYTAEFLQAASLRPGNPITVAGIQVGTVTSMKLDGDHVEAGLKIRDDVALGSDSKAVIKLATILGARYVAITPDGPGRLSHSTFDLSHTEVPYDLQSALQDAASTFEQVDSDRFAQSLAVLGKQLKGLPELVPQALANMDTLSSIIAQRRDQVGQLLKNTERVTNTLHNQQARIGNLVNQGQDLMGVFVSRRAVFHAMMQSLQSLVDVLSRLVINDRPALDALLRDMGDLTTLLGKHNDLMRNMLQVSPVLMREVANMTGDGNAIVGNGPGGVVIDSWMCAISGRAKQFGMIPYFKDCK